MSNQIFQALILVFFSTLQHCAFYCAKNPLQCRMFEFAIGVCKICNLTFIPLLCKTIAEGRTIWYDAQNVDVQMQKCKSNFFKL